VRFVSDFERLVTFSNCIVAFYNESRQKTSESSRSQKENAHGENDFREPAGVGFGEEPRVP
jgi:hypothetical protein